MPRPITAHIDSQAIAHNVDIIKQNAKESNTFAVLKANAYGHGIQNVYKGLKKADGIAVLDLAEAVLVRELGWQKKILLLEGFFEISDLALIEKYQLDIVIHADWQIDILKHYLKRLKFNFKHLKNKYNIFLKMNSGMNRLGLSPELYQKAFLELAELKQQGFIGKITHMTHFANADIKANIDNASTPNHLKNYDVNAALHIFHQNIANLYQICQPQSASFLSDVFGSSSANSGGILWHANSHHSAWVNMANAQSWVRGGIMLYGASPSGRYQDIHECNLQPTMSLKSKIISIQELKAGEAVGYGSQFIAPEPMKIATVACGYADGYPRIAQNAPVYLHAQKTHTLGRISMDMLAIDLRGYQNSAAVNIGDEVLLWGQSMQNQQQVILPIDDVANAAQTIGYELMCGITRRVKII